METFVKVVGVIVIGVFAIAGISVVMAFPTMWVVNYLFTPGIIMSLFGASHLTVWKAMALNFICGTLFKGSSSKSED